MPSFISSLSDTDKWIYGICATMIITWVGHVLAQILNHRLAISRENKKSSLSEHNTKNTLTNLQNVECGSLLAGADNSIEPSKELVEALSKTVTYKLVHLHRLTYNEDLYIPGKTYSFDITKIKPEGWLDCQIKAGLFELVKPPKDGSQGQTP